MTRMTSRLAIACALMTLIGGTAIAQETAQQPDISAQPNHAASSAKVSSRAFVHRAAVSDLFEIQSSQLAEKQSSNDAVKAFAARMIQDHTKSTSALMDALEQARLATSPVSLPTILDRPHQAMVSQLQHLSGSAFDRRYMTLQIKAHQQALSLLENYGSFGSSDPLKQFAKTITPTVEDHLQMAQKLVNSGYKVSGM